MNPAHFLLLATISAPGNPAAGQPPIESDRGSQRAAILLEQWSTRTANCSTFEVEYRCFEYDRVFGVERRGKGRWLFNARGQSRWDVQPTVVPVAPAGRIRVEAMPAETRILTSDGLILIHHDEKTYERLDHPPAIAELPGKPLLDADSPSWIEGIASPFACLPLPYFAPGSRLNQRWDWLIVSEEKSKIRLKAVPRGDSELLRVRSFEVILDGCSFQTEAIKITDSTGNRESVFVLANVSLNKPWSSETGLDPFRASVEGYREIVQVRLRTISLTELLIELLTGKGPSDPK
jgi:hypothetical protein